MYRTTPVMLVAAALLAAPGVSHAQQQTRPPAPPPPPAAATPAADPAAPYEAEQLRQKISQLELQARQDPSVKPVAEALDAAVRAAMGRLDAQAPARSARALQLDREVEAARAANDNAKLNQLADEATALKAYFDGLRRRALAQPDVQQARQAYLARVFERMKQIDPRAQEYVDRLTAVHRGMAARTGGGTGSR